MTDYTREGEMWKATCLEESDSDVSGVYSSLLVVVCYPQAMRWKAYRLVKSINAK